MNAIFSIARIPSFATLKTGVPLSLRVAHFAKNLFAFLSSQTARAALALRHSFDLAYPFLGLVSLITLICLLNIFSNAPPAAPEIDPPAVALEPRDALEAEEVLAIIDRINAAPVPKQTDIEELLTAGIGRQYYCSLALHLIRDPVRDPTARGAEPVYYERDSIREALRINPASPHTRLPLTFDQLEEAPPEYFAGRTEALLRTFNEEITNILNRAL